jgi:hypothetical protein
MAPLCTALTIMALRRVTHRFVSVGGKLKRIVFVCRKTSSFDGSLSITFSAMKRTIVSQSPQWSSVADHIVLQPNNCPIDLASPRRRR